MCISRASLHGETCGSWKRAPTATPAQEAINPHDSHKSTRLQRRCYESTCKAPHLAQGSPPPPSGTAISNKHGSWPGQTHSVDQRPSLGCRPVGWRWGPRSTGTASEHLQLVLATATIALPPVSPWPLKRKNTSPNTCHQRTMSIPGLLPLPCPC